ncbi:glycosyl transferase [Rhizobium sp. L1K21]|uniref:glycosyl transferase n=1 Tax=Rhizobium sp. L1K21 TaxID=2954933 RepID=UPI002091FED8|nr:glycosyl transferase [Rhizobium sp. L1K21]MCO6186928.1 glycosyl transferase [Rhizobium sp. L1K21]
MLTIIMECQDNEAEAAHTLSALVVGAVEGLVSDVVILDESAGEGIQALADAAGARFHRKWDIREVVNSARGNWILLLEPGARLQPGWVEDLLEYLSLGRDPACFTPSKTFRKPLLRRFGRRPPLENGLLLTKLEAKARARSGMALGDFAKGVKKRKLRAEIAPAWVANGLRRA